MYGELRGGGRVREDGSLKRERKQRTVSLHNVTENIRFESRCRFRNTPRALHIYPQEERDILREERQRAG